MTLSLPMLSCHHDTGNEWAGKASRKNTAQEPDNEVTCSQPCGRTSQESDVPTIQKLIFSWQRRKTHESVDVTDHAKGRKECKDVRGDAKISDSLQLGGGGFQGFPLFGENNTALSSTPATLC